MENPSITPEAVQDRDEFINRILNDSLAAFNIFAIHIGDRLGFYRELADQTGLTSAELASRTGTQERYVREWLEQQAAACMLDVVDGVSNPDMRKFRLAPGRVEVLTDRDSLNYLAPMAQLIAGAVSPLDQLLQAYRTGEGLAFSQYGVHMREGQANMNRPMFLKQLGEEFLPGLTELHTRLQSAPPAYVADIGCGAGWSSIGIARSYPQVIVHGYDLDEASVELAQGNIQEAGLQDRVQVMFQDAEGAGMLGQYDLAIAFECVHDMSNPVGVLRTMRNLVNQQGTVIVMDERTMDEFQPCAEAWEQILYGFSILHCLPVGMSDQPSAATGTVMRSSTLERYAQEAGFSRVEILPIDHFFFRFYRLVA
jgi:2-polyprenyl-3-methyl-5-hydroxy-6-metoxy-1,4-benzoquinol methylase